MELNLCRSDHGNMSYDDPPGRPRESRHMEGDAGVCRSLANLRENAQEDHRTIIGKTLEHPYSTWNIIGKSLKIIKNHWTIIFPLDFIGTSSHSTWILDSKISIQEIFVSKTQKSVMVFNLAPRIAGHHTPFSCIYVYRYHIYIWSILNTNNIYICIFDLLNIDCIFLSFYIYMYPFLF